MRVTQRFLSPISQHSSNGGSGGLVAVRPEVSVDVQSRLRAAVPEPVLHHFDVQAATDQQRREVVPQIVEAELAGQPGDPRPGRSDRPLDRPGRRLPAGAVGDDVVATGQAERITVSPLGLGQPADAVQAVRTQWSAERAAEQQAARREAAHRIAAVESAHDQERGETWRRHEPRPTPARTHDGIGR